MAETKYIFVTGGVASSLGKGIISSSIGNLLQARGYNVTIQKFDPYINIDPGTLNPYEHGECYVTVDGHEADLDLGHYERFLGIQTTKANNITTGRIYKSVIDKERRGDYLGKTIQIIPHITDEIKRNVKLLGNKYKFDFVITEIGGTVGDIESLPYLESIRQLKWELGRNALCVHLTYVPYLAAAKELKTKPTQHSVKELQSVGIQPDILVLRSEHELNANLRKKVALFCCIPDSEKSLNYLVGLMYGQLIQALYHEADRKHKGRLPVPVHLLIDEAPNISLPTDSFLTSLATMRSRGIFTSYICQNMAQIKALFKDSWESLVGLCDEFLYIGGNEKETHKYVSEMLGKQTLSADSHSRSRGRNGSYSTSTQLTGRELLTPDEVRLLDNGKAILFVRGERPMMDNKYDLKRHPNVRYTEDGGAPPYDYTAARLSASDISGSPENYELLDMRDFLA